MNDLDTLRPEVREALDKLGYFLTGTHNHNDFYFLRAELLRLQSTESRANEWQLRAERAEAELAEARKNETVALGLWNAAEGRATKAEAELAEAQNTIAAQQGTMGALKRKLALAEGELAALKARIADSRTTDVFESEGHAGMVAMGGLPCEWIGKNVRLVVED